MESIQERLTTYLSKGALQPVNQAEVDQERAALVLLGPSLLEPLFSAALELIKNCGRSLNEAMAVFHPIALKGIALVDDRVTSLISELALDSPPASGRAVAREIVRIAGSGNADQQVYAILKCGTAGLAAAEVVPFLAGFLPPIATTPPADALVVLVASLALSGLESVPPGYAASKRLSEEMYEGLAMKGPIQGLQGALYRAAVGNELVIQMAIR